MNALLKLNFNTKKHIKRGFTTIMITINELNNGLKTDQNVVPKKNEKILGSK